MKLLSTIFPIATLWFAFCQAGDDCGRTPIEPIIDGRIVNGIEARDHSWPFQVLALGGTPPSLRPGCGGSLIRRNYVLTAAHCVDGGISPRRLYYKMGSNGNSGSVTEGERLIQAKRIFPHPNYGVGVHGAFDLAVIELKELVEFTDHIQPVCLARVDQHLQEGHLMFNIGWGDDENGNNPVMLRQVRLQYHTREECERIYQEHGREFHESLICVGGHDNKSACFGDSGGPLITRDSIDHRFYQYGVVSHGVIGSPCTHPDNYNGFGRVPFMCDFIKSVIGHEVCRMPPSALGSMKKREDNRKFKTGQKK